MREIYPRHGGQHDAITKYWDYESFMDARRCRPMKLKRAVATIKNGREGKGEAARRPGREWHPFAAAPIIDRRNADECLLLLPGSRQADKYRRGSVERAANISEARSHPVRGKIWPRASRSASTLPVRASQRLE